MDDTRELGTMSVRARKLTLRLGEREFQVETDTQGRVSVDGAPFTVTLLPEGAVQIENGSTQRGWTASSTEARWVFLDGRVYEFEVQHPGHGKTRASGHHGSLTAPMPATVRRIEVKPGDEVKKGQTLILLEAMKMELPVRAASDGKVTSVNCREGELVQPGATLVEFNETD